MFRSSIRLCCTSAFLLVTSAIALAAQHDSGDVAAPAKDRGVLQSDTASVSPDADESAAPPLHREDGIAYRTGGIGKDERDGLLLTTRGYGLKLVFAGRQQADFVADVAVDIFDPSGRKVLSAHDAGPLFFADLPPGQYRIDVNCRGRSFERTATVTPGKQTELAFFW
jgi:hypothetical protein